MLKTTKEFDFVYKNSYKFRTETLDICVLKPNLMAQFYTKFRRIPSDFVGFSVSKKVGIAVERNLIKRKLRAICREFFNIGNSSLARPSRELEKFSFDRQPALSQSNFSVQPTNLTQDTRIANDLKKSKDSSMRGSLSEAKTTKQSKESTNLICIFIAKNKILQMPFSALKESIFATLKRQINFRSDLHKNKRDFRKPSTNLKSTNSANRAHTKALQK